MKRPASESTTPGHQQRSWKQQAVQAEAHTATNKQEQLQSLTSERSTHHCWRLELFFKSEEDLSRQLPFLRQHGLFRLNITNKSADDDLLANLHQLSATLLQSNAEQVLPHQQPSTAQQQTQHTGSTPHRQASDLAAQHQHRSQQGANSTRCSSHAAGNNAGVQPSEAATLDVCIHYSLKYQYDTSPQRALARLLHFCQALLDQQQQQQQQQPQEPPSTSPGCAHPNVHVLLVSGGGKKKRFDSLAALQALQQLQQQQGAQGHLRLPSLAVAFNPYLPGKDEAAEEQHRLQAKLETCLVDKVYLQMGTDLRKLETGLSYVKELVQQLSAKHPGFKPPQLLGSVFLPTRRLLAQMRFRPWNGVFLSEEYLSSVEAAEGITRQLLRAYAAAGVVPLLESAVKTDEDFRQANWLLGFTNPAQQH